MLFFGWPTLELPFWCWGTPNCVNLDKSGVLSSPTEPKVGKAFCLSSPRSPKSELISKAGPMGCSHLKLWNLREWSRESVQLEISPAGRMDWVAEGCLKVESGQYLVVMTCDVLSCLTTLCATWFLVLWPIQHVFNKLLMCINWLESIFFVCHWKLWKQQQIFMGSWTWMWFTHPLSLIFK